MLYCHDQFIGVWTRKATKGNINCIFRRRYTVYFACVRELDLVAGHAQFNSRICQQEWLSIPLNSILDFTCCIEHNYNICARHRTKKNVLYKRVLSKEERQSSDSCFDNKNCLSTCFLMLRYFIHSRCFI